jgi:hypothetical protein
MHLNVKYMYFKQCELNILSHDLFLMINVIEINFTLSFHFLFSDCSSNDNGYIIVLKKELYN